MSTIVKVDEKGRIIIPKHIRKKTEIREGSYVKVAAKDKSIILEPVEPFTDKYFGVFKIDNWPEDLDEFTIEAMKKWWAPQDT